MKNAWLYIAVGFAWFTTAFAGDWPQLGGPARNNISTETGLADSWPSSGPNVLWEKTVSDGYSGPTIKDGKIYLIDHEGDDSILRCLALSSGEEIWNYSFSDPGKMSGGKFAGTRGNPTVTDDAVYLVTGHGTFICMDLRTRQVKWMHHLLKDYGNKLHQFGVVQAPFIYKNMVLVAPNTKEAGAAAYDTTTGERLWVSSGLGDHAYITPQVVEFCGQEMVLAVGSKQETPKPRRRQPGAGPEEPVAPPMAGHITGLSLKDGSVLWDYTGWQCDSAIPAPVLLSDNRLFITGDYGAGSAMIQVVRDGPGFAAREIYKTDAVGAQLQPPIQVGDHFFIGSNGNGRKDGLVCFSLDGKLEWRTKDIEGAPNFERGPFILADGKLILLDGKSGILYLVKADASGYKQLAAAQMVKENSMAWAPLALSGGKLLVRDWNTLKCVDLK